MRGSGLEDGRSVGDGTGGAGAPEGTSRTTDHRSQGGPPRRGAAALAACGAAGLLLAGATLTPGAAAAPTLAGDAPATVLGADGSAAAVPAALAVVGGTVLVGPDLAAVRDGVVLIRGGRVACTGRRADCPVPDSADVLDARGRWVLPGLIDTHVHLPGGASVDPALEQARRFAEGVTATREASTRGRMEANLALQGVSEAAEAALPRLVVAARASDAADGVDLVRRLADAGVDAIKLKEPRPPPARRAIHRAAAGRDLPVYGHPVPAEPPALSPLPELLAGMDGVSHLHALPYPAIRDWGRVPAAPGPDATRPERRRWTAGLWAEAEPARLRHVAVAMAERGVWLEPTLAGEAEFLEGAGSAGGRRATDAVAGFLRAYVDAGGTVVAGSDASAASEPGLYDELRLLVRFGLSRREALRAATSDAARVLGRPDLGAIEPGRRADLAVLEADPLADIRSSRRVWRVVKGGVVHAPASVLRVARAEAAVRRWESRREARGGPLDAWVAAARRHGGTIVAGAGILMLGTGLLGLWRIQERA